MAAQKSLKLIYIGVLLALVAVVSAQLDKTVVLFAFRVNSGMLNSTRGEEQSQEDVSKIFTALDQNKDGKVSKDEVPICMGKFKLEPNCSPGTIKWYGYQPVGLYGLTTPPVSICSMTNRIQLPTSRPFARTCWQLASCFHQYVYVFCIVEIQLEHVFCIVETQLEQVFCIVKTQLEPVFCIVKTQLEPVFCIVKTQLELNSRYSTQIGRQNRSAGSTLHSTNKAGAVECSLLIAHYSLFVRTSNALLCYQPLVLEPTQ
eukprot:jgi/Botrbrau1/10839/Bobra.0025s0018.1